MPAARKSGLSPRGRGKRRQGRPDPNHYGSIPAWAGETEAVAGEYGISGVYPRVGGGNGLRKLLEAKDCGLSPRGRGKQPAKPDTIRRPRSIPAWAGETNVCYCRISKL